MVAAFGSSKHQGHARNWKVEGEPHCVLCPLRAYEDMIHLFFTWNFSQRVWNYLQILWIQHDDLQTVITAAKDSFQKPFFMEVLVTACWHIWLQRNGHIFRNQRASFSKWKVGFLHDMSMLRHRLKRKFLDSFTVWLDSLP